MTRYIFIFLLAGMTLLSCAGNDDSYIDDTGSASTPVISLLNTQAFDNSITPLSFISSVEAVPLQSTSDPNSIIAETAKVIRAGDKFIVFDNKFYGLKVFDRAGNYLYRIGKTGKGPGEYTRITDVELYDPAMLAVLADNTTIIYYNLEGDYLKSKRMGFFASDFEMLDNNNFFFYINNNISDRSKNYNLLQTDSNFRIVRRFFKITNREEVPSFAFTGFLVREGNSLLYSDAFSDRILRFDNDRFKTEYRLDFQGRQMPDNVKTDLRGFSKKAGDYDYLGKDIIESGDYLISSCVVKRHMDYVMYDKKQNRYNMLSNVDKKSDYLARLFSTPVGKDGQSLFVNVAPELIEYLKESGADYLSLVRSKNAELYNVLTAPKQSDNPILLVCNLTQPSDQAKR
jgi:hypothetical protein